MQNHISFDTFMDLVCPGAAHTDDTLAAGINLDGFKLALIDLDQELEERGARPVTINAFGGFALMCHGLRTERPITLDIDTCSPDFDGLQTEALHAVAKRLHLPEDWINNQIVFARGERTTDEDCHALDTMLEATYLPASKIIEQSNHSEIDEDFFNMSRVTLNIAELPTLAKSKAYAVSSIGQGRTSKDALDFIDVLRALGCNTLNEACDRMPWLMDPEFSDLSAILDETLGENNAFVDIDLSIESDGFTAEDILAILEMEAGDLRDGTDE